MTDLISRQDAIDAATRFRVTPGGDFFEAIKRAIRKELEALPAAEPKSYRMGYQAGYAAAQRWTPCSKELPKKDGDYYVTTHDGQIARYIFIKGASEEYWMRCATAWMPLPKPYKGEE